jgi:hypothetical protein
MAIDTNSIPALDLSMLIVDGNGAEQETAIFFVKPVKSRLDFSWLAGS